MYSFKEKSKWLRELIHSSHAASDLSLLKRIAPDHALFKISMRDPGRFAERILFALLDLTRVEDILINRRNEVKEQKDVKKESNEKSKTKSKNSPPKGNRRAADPLESSGRNPEKSARESDPGKEPGEDDVNARLKETGDKLDSTQEELEETREKLEEIKEELEETRDELDSTQEELEEVKEERNSIREELEEEKKSVLNSDA
jgi:chromosome segregation ATPase